jgi:hypothetical protein
MANWTENMIKDVWEKGEVVANHDSSKWRKDQCQAWILWDEYGNRDSQYGWEIDHISPGGEDILSNLRPLQWQNNVDKSDGRLKCNVTADGTKNINQE